MSHIFISYSTYADALANKSILTTPPAPHMAFDVDRAKNWSDEFEHKVQVAIETEKYEREKAAYEAERARQYGRGVTMSDYADLKPAPFAWLELPVGKVTLINDWDDEPTYVGKKGQSKTLEVAPFAIAKYPITNAQFAEFINAGGYSEKRWWTKAGWEARLKGWEWISEDLKETGKPWAEPRYWGDSKWNGEEQPVVGVSWYEAIAFCQWLSEVSGEEIRLPTETEWQWAAGGKNQLAYPWGKDWDCGRCNNSVSPCDSNQTTPVRHYEGKGDSPFGVVDMTGNVWEWCLTDYQSGVNSLEGDNNNRRVLRGGSWHGDVTGYFRVADRDGDVPHYGNRGGGFRCARSHTR